MVNLEYLTDEIFQPRRALQLHEPKRIHHAEEKTANNKDLQQNAAPPREVQTGPVTSPDEFTISVEHVREHLRKKGLTKSKDTVQRWCRTGALSCQKRGVFGRYFTTEASLLKLEQKLLPDMIAENVGSKLPEPSVQPDAAASVEIRSGMQLHEDVDAPARSETRECPSSEVLEPRAA